MPNFKELSIVIVNYRSEKYLGKCISSIKEKILDADYEIIVVNNDKEKLLEAQLPKEIRLINSGGNIGFGAACNLGAKSAQGEILCFLNPDTEIISSSFSGVLYKFAKDNKLAIVGPKLVNEGGETQEWIAGGEITIWSTILNNFGYKRDQKIWESVAPMECAWVSGAAMFIRKDIFDRLGGFDEKFFMYFEDSDLCRRARQLGYKVLYFPEFIVKHFGGKSWLDKKTQKAYYHKSQRRYFSKYFIK
ncbi:MAG: glycosyltransferase family 2 protein [Parcubacteria group bacterium]